MTDVRGGAGLHGLIPIGLFGGIAFLLGADLASDVHAGHAPTHLALEVLAGGLALGGVALFGLHARALHRAADGLDSDLRACAEDAARWRKEAQQALKGLADAIDRQLERWDLTEAEREVALLLLKGLSHKEIANLRRTSEGTVRQQALGVYRKSGLGGRSALAAFFLEDLVLPVSPTS